jgi:hypothetical protein
MAILSLKAVRRTLAVVLLAIASIPLVWGAAVWEERRAARTAFDRIEVGMSFADVMYRFQSYQYSGPNKITFEWKAIPAVEGGMLPLNFGSANAGFMVCFERRAPKDLRVFYKQFHEKPAKTILRERWRAAFGSAPPF